MIMHAVMVGGVRKKKRGKPTHPALIFALISATAVGIHDSACANGRRHAWIEKKGGPAPVVFFSLCNNRVEGI